MREKQALERGKQFAGVTFFRLSLAIVMIEFACFGETVEIPQNRNIASHESRVTIHV